MPPSLTELFLASADRSPDRTALVDSDNRISFRQYAGAALAIAATLDKRSESERLALLAPTCSAFAMLQMGAILSGRVPIPLNFFLSPEELAKVVADSGVKTLYAARFFEKLAHALPCDVVILEDFIPEALATAPAAPAPPNPVATILYTSGTTGVPKGVVLSQKNILANVHGCIEHMGFTRDNVLLAILPLFHTFALTTTLFVPAVVGAASVLMPRFEPRAALETIEREKVTALLAVPSMFKAMLRVLERTPVDLSTLRLPMSGGEPLSQDTFNLWRDRYGVTILEGYGLTEASPVVCANNSSSFKQGTVGRPLPNVEVRICDDLGQDAGVNVDGEIYVRADSVMQGYLNRPDETAAAITENAFLKTGDIGRIDEQGFLEITGRKKEMIICAGQNVFPREIEQALLAHPAVSECAVIAIPDDTRGEAPKAFVVLAEGASADEEELKFFCREHIARFKLPAQIEFLSEFPYSPSGKILKKQLAKSPPAKEEPPS